MVDIPRGLPLGSIPASSQRCHWKTSSTGFTVDLRVAKTLVPGGRAKLDLMVEMFNLLDRTNYTEANVVFRSMSFPDNPNSNFGQFTKAAPPFQAQLAQWRNLKRLSMTTLP